MSEPSRSRASRAQIGDIAPVAVDDSAVVTYEWSRRDWLLRRGLAVADAASLVSALAVAGVFVDRARDDAASLLLLGLAFLPAWILLFKIYGLYDRDIRRISHAVLDEMPWLVHAVLLGSLGFWAVAKLAPVDPMTLAEGSVLFGLALVLVLFFRSVVRRLMVGALGPERLIVIGENGIAPSLAQKLLRHPEYGVRPIGALIPDGAGEELGGLPRLGSPADFARAVRELHVERALICREGLTGSEVTWLVDEARRLGVKTGIVPDTVEALGYSVEIDDVEGVTILSVNPPVLSRTSRLLKRAFDLAIVAVVALPALLLGMLIAIWVKVSSRGPVFYRQTRIGRGGRPFQLLKFRTMHANADRLRGELMALSRDPNWLDLREDPRITPVGRFLRHFSLDELPQLINVLSGRMSMVGPRPLIEEESGQVVGWARSRHDLTPGMTGLWQVLGRTDIPFEEMVKLDYMYVTNWSLWLDVKILLRTIPVVLARRGVN